MSEKVSITIETKYHRSQFDDWLAGGKIEYGGKIYHWSADNNNYGFGWEVEPVCEEDWADLAEGEFHKIINLIEDCLYKHQTEHVLPI